MNRDTRQQSPHLNFIHVLWILGGWPKAIVGDHLVLPLGEGAVGLGQCVLYFRQALAQVLQLSGPVRHS